MPLPQKNIQLPRKRIERANTMITLIAEDDFTCRLLLQKLLAPYGECHVAINGREALTAFKEARDRRPAYNLICLDIMMPEMDGQATLKEIRAIEDGAGTRAGKGVKILMTTALNDMENVQAALRERCDGYLIKPVDKAKLLKYLREFGLT
jgi:two-component system chemotaxis response regulator CheY